MESKHIIIIVVVLVLICCCSSSIIGGVFGIIYTKKQKKTETSTDSSVDVPATNSTTDTKTDVEEEEVNLPIEPEDITLSKPFADGKAFPVGNLVDNNETTFTHTNAGEKEWIKITLKNEVPITKIEIVNRKDCCQDRIVGATLTITDSSGAQTYTTTIQEILPKYTITPSAKGKVIQLQRPDGGKPLNIAEFKIYVKKSSSETYPKPTEWKCVGDNDAPLSKNSAGDIQCMSADGKNCVSGKCTDNILSPPSPIKPLVCGDEHKKQWGITGYDKPDHWCSLAKTKL